MIEQVSQRVKVLVVDDSAVVRQTLAEILASDPGIEVIGTAGDPYVATERMRRQTPDVITLDIEMPRMDGLTFLQKLMAQHPIPVVICSSLAAAGCDTTLRALEYGAVEIIQKPSLGTKQFLEESRVRICDAVKAAARARPGRRRPGDDDQALVTPKLTADAVIAPPRSSAMLQTTERVVAVGASTGGTEALRVFLEALPADAPGMVVVQHMPEMFTAAFARRLDELCAVTVKEAADGDAVVRGRVLIAPGEQAHPPQAQRRPVPRGGGERSAGVPPPPLGGRALPVGGALRRQERGGRHHDRHGRRRCLRHGGDEGRRRADAGPGRGHLRRVRDAEGGHQARGRRPGGAPGTARARGPAALRIGPRPQVRRSQ